jgi:peptide/nickel transport system ATP-binding protein
MMVMRLLDQTSGRIVFDGDEIGAILPNAFARLPLRTSIQMVFQDPADSLNPRFTGARAIVDPMMQLGDRGRDALRARCEELAGLVGLPVNLLDRFPHQLSGGQEARVAIARHRAPSETGGSGRADSGARRLGAGGGIEFAARSEAVHGHELFIRVA